MNCVVDLHAFIRTFINFKKVWKINGWNLLKAKEPTVFKKKIRFHPEVSWTGTRGFGNVARKQHHAGDVDGGRTSLGRYYEAELAVRPTAQPSKNRSREPSPLSRPGDRRR